jgi:hypothetical protein
VGRTDYRHEDTVSAPNFQLVFTKWPFLRQPIIFKIGNPPHAIPYLQKRTLGGTYFHGRHGHAINKKQSSKSPHQKNGIIEPFLKRSLLHEKWL